MSKYTIPHSKVIASITRALEIIEKSDDTLLYSFLREIAVMESGGSQSGKEEITHHEPNPFQMTKVGIIDTMKNADGGKHWTMRRMHPIVNKNANMSKPWVEQQISEIKSNITMNAIAAALLIIRKDFTISSSMKERAIQWKQFYNTTSDKHGTPEIYIRKNNIAQKASPINESKTLQDSMFKPLQQAIIDSKFWTYDNQATDADYNVILKNDIDQTEAAEVLTSALNDFFRTENIPVTAAVHTPDPETNEKTVINPGHKNYPNKLIIGANQGLAGDNNKKGSSKFLMNLHLGTYGDNFSTSDIEPSQLAQNAGTLIRHELVHLYQIEARRKNQRISRLSTLKKLRDEGEIPDAGAPREDYLSSKIEIDAYAHEIAEELLHNYGKEKAFSILRGEIDTSTLDASEQFHEYLTQNKDSSFTRRLRRKIYGNIVDLTTRSLY